MRYVYALKNLINGKVYVGQTKNPVKRRDGHFYDARHGKKKPLYCAIRKYGHENFSFEVLEECSDELVNTREQHWVAHFDSFNPKNGYNLTNGGNQHFNHSEETKKRIGEATTKRQHGKNNPMFGKSAPWLTSLNKSRTGKPGRSRYGTENPSFGKKGARSPIAKLTQEQVEQILKTKGTGRAVGAQFGVSRTTIERIRNGTSSYVKS